MSTTESALHRERNRMARDLVDREFQNRHGRSRFAYLDNQQSYSSSSPPQPWLSSPTPRTMQRPVETSFQEQSSDVRSATSGRYRGTYGNYNMPFPVEQLEAEEQNHQILPTQPIANIPLEYKQSRTVQANEARSYNGAPVVQGITLISTREMPDSFRSLFHFPFFNAVQSRCFTTIYQSDDNFVLSSPTGSGKTAVLELAICRIINTTSSGSYKIVYQAPTKSLCAERQRDWQAKFGPLGLQCAELTGDTEGGGQLRNVQSATIIITTPEKWDSMTRKWKDHKRLMLMVKLFLIDEVHILKEDRGATLEAVVSRMKSVESNVRFVALSATVPNSEDIASWLGQGQAHPWLPAAREVFGEEYRPVRLQKHVCGYTGTQNEFAFEKILTSKLIEVISRYSQRKPIMIFCFTRNSCADTAKLLAEWWRNANPRDRFWQAPQSFVPVIDKDLRDIVLTGVAFHHAGLALDDRTGVERAYLAGEVNVICCTSTLAVGVNLPCHMVIVKHTVSYGGPGVGCKEYSDLEVMQMLGRAGRPQFDNSAIAVIMTRTQKVPYYERMISGSEVLESRLHLNLIDHLNSEIGLGTITNASTAKKWLKGTFLYVRLKENPEHYKIDGSTSSRTLDERLENICRDGIAALENHDLVISQPKLHCTEFGNAMARYYLQFGTMKILLSLQPQSKVSEILSAIAQATEFADVRFRANEKPTYKELNKNSSIKFPIPVNLDSPAHKVSLIVQSVLGAVELPTEDAKQRNEYATARSLIFQHANRFVKCIIDCQLHVGDSVTARNGLMLSRSLGAQVWDDSPLHMKQLDAIGIVSVRKLASAQIKSIEELEDTEPQRIETVLSRNPPFGSQIVASAKLFPKLRVSLKCVGEPSIVKGEHVTVQINVEIGFLNDRIPECFRKRPVYACMLAERSDGHIIHFARTSAKKLNQGQDVRISVDLLNASQSVRAYVMCDELAGTMRYAILKPDLPASVFLAPKVAGEPDQQSSTARSYGKRAARDNDSRSVDEFGDAGIDDADLAFVEDEGFTHIDDLDDESGAVPTMDGKKRKTPPTRGIDHLEPHQLGSGKWACNHSCKDKTSCKHMCCREGLDKQPKARAAKREKAAESVTDPRQTQLNMLASKKQRAEQPKDKHSAALLSHGESDLSRNLSRLPEVTENDISMVSVLSTRPLSASHKHTHSQKLSFLSDHKEDETTDYGSDSWSSNGLPSARSLIRTRAESRRDAENSQLMAVDRHVDDNHDEEDMLDRLHAADASNSLREGDDLDPDFETDPHNVIVTTQDPPRRPGSCTPIAHRSRNHPVAPSSPLFLHNTTSSSIPIPSAPRNPPISSPDPPAHLGTSISETSTPMPNLIIREDHSAQNIPTDPTGLTTPSNIEPDGSELQPTRDPLATWFEQEFGTQLFDYVG
nr:atp-dependent dna helicase mer3 [Quercus suber]